MGFQHKPVRHNILWPTVVRIKCGWVPVHFMYSRPIKVDDNCATLGRVEEDVGVPQVTKYDVLFVKEMHCLTDMLRYDGRDLFFFYLELPKSFPIHTVHHNHVQATNDALTKV